MVVCMCKFCDVWVCVCVGFVMCGFCDMWVCVCVGFVMCGCVYVWVFHKYMYLYVLVFSLFRLCIFILIYSVSTAVRTAATE